MVWVYSPNDKRAIVVDLARLVDDRTDGNPDPDMRPSFPPGCKARPPATIWPGQRGLLGWLRPSACWVSRQYRRKGWLVAAVPPLMRRDGCNRRVALAAEPGVLPRQCLACRRVASAIPPRSGGDCLTFTT